MKIDRRALLGGLAAAVAVPPRLYAATITDATGRAVTTPDHVVRVYPAGPPAAVTLYTLAPDLLLGWIEAPGEKECEFLCSPTSRRGRRCRASTGAATPISTASPRSSPTSSSTSAPSMPPTVRSPSVSKE